MSILITADELGRIIASGVKHVIIDARWQLTKPGAPSSFPQSQQEFAAGHIPGARLVDVEGALTNHDAQGQGRHPLPTREQLKAEFSRIGVDADSIVVVYDGGNSMAAARVWWLLTDAGKKDVLVLDGGLPAWQGELETGDAAPVEPGTWEPTPGQRGRMTADQVAATITAGHRAIDVRAAERFRGETEPLDPVAGHIPGAENIPATQLQNADGTFRTPDEIAERVGEISLGDVVYCGSGVTASNVLLALESSGIHGAVIYPGSWSEWSTAGREVETSL